MGLLSEHLVNWCGFTAGFAGLLTFLFRPIADADMRPASDW